MQTLVQEVKDYALANYEKGWDVVVETMTDSDIADVIKDAKTGMGAKRAMSAHIRPFVDMRNEVRAA